MTERLGAASGGTAFGPMPFLDVMAMGGGLPVQRKGAADGSTVVAGGGTHVVKEKETLWSIAEGEYGHGKYWKRIANANPGKVEGGHIPEVGTELVLPRIEVPTMAALREKLDDERNDQDGMRDLAVGMSDEQYGAFLAGLDQAERDANAKVLQIVELMRSTGRTLEELGDDQRRWIEREAKRVGKPPGLFVKDRADVGAYGGADTSAWDELPQATKDQWTARFNAVEAEIRAQAPPDLQAVIAKGDARKGAFVFDPAGTLASNAFAFVFQGQLHCGTHFVLAAEADVTRVWPSIVHELGGHVAYGGMLGNAIIGNAVNGMSPQDAAVAKSGKKLTGVYGYMETEIFAELYEASYDAEGQDTDRPFDLAKRTNEHGITREVGADIHEKLDKLRAAFEPSISLGLIQSLALRVEIDGYIQPAVKARFRHLVKTLYGDILPAWSDPPELQQ